MSKALADYNAKMAAELASDPTDTVDFAAKNAAVKAAAAKLNTETEAVVAIIRKHGAELSGKSNGLIAPDATV